jgi:hypothetical protein
MANTPAGFRAALFAGWIVLGAAGIGYARVKDIPNWAALPVLAAFLIAYPFYLLPAFPALRSRLAGWKLDAYALAGMLAPYFACTFGAVEFHWTSVARLAALALAMSLWFRLLPRAAVFDLAFLAIVPAVLLGKYFDPVYVSRYPGWRDLIVLGHLGLIQMAAIALLEVRRVPDPGFGFLPALKDAGIGLLYFAGFIAVAAPVAVLLHLGHAPCPVAAWKVIGSLFGFLWVVALSEEFLVQGVLLDWLADWTRSRTAALAATSAIFGSLHLWFGTFPNWPMAAVTAILGAFCALSRFRAGTIRAAMVTHALAATARLFVMG